jgi:hypothetical protein
MLSLGDFSVFRPKLACCRCEQTFRDTGFVNAVKLAYSGERETCVNCGLSAVLRINVLVTFVVGAVASAVWIPPISIGSAALDCLIFAIWLGVETRYGIRVAYADS